MDGSSSSCILPGVIASTFHRVYFFEPHFVCRFVNWFLCVLSKVLSFLAGILLKNSVILSFFKRQTLQILVCLMNPKSMGAVSIQHRGKGENCRGLSNFDVQIDPAYLSREEDFVGISLGAHIVKKLSSCWIPNSIELLPGYLYKGIGGSDYLRKYVSDFALPYYHWSGTCSIKSDLVSEGSHVVDEQLRVRQVTNLYICDASVHPKIISAPPALTLAAMGLTVSSILHDLIRPKTE
jgi:Choline dehydrogenase and related flavoproteins